MTKHVVESAMPNKKRIDYLVIEGPIGVGKTSIARKLANDFSAELLLELVDENPFLKQFYKDIKKFSLPTQLYFLLSRLEILQKLQQRDIFSCMIVSDFLLEKDQLFARLLLDDKQFDLYRKIYHNLQVPSIRADLVVYLQAPVSVLMERIRERGRAFEQTIDAEYLNHLNNAYLDFFYHYKKSPVLIVNTVDVDFINNKDEYCRLKEHILKVESAKYYYNPAPYELKKHGK